jgi:hypothetical protein
LRVNGRYMSAAFREDYRETNLPSFACSFPLSSVVPVRNRQCLRYGATYSTAEDRTCANDLLLLQYASSQSANGTWSIVVFCLLIIQ